MQDTLSEYPTASASFKARMYTVAKSGKAKCPVTGASVEVPKDADQFLCRCGMQHALTRKDGRTLVWKCGRDE